MYRYSELRILKFRNLLNYSQSMAKASSTEETSFRSVMRFITFKMRNFRFSIKTSYNLQETL